MTVLLLIATMVAVAYVVFALVKCGVPESISATYYLLGRQGWVLQLVLALMAVCLYPVWFSECREGWECLPFLGVHCHLLGGLHNDCANDCQVFQELN